MFYPNLPPSPLLEDFHLLSPGHFKHSQKQVGPASVAPGGAVLRREYPIGRIPASPGAISWLIFLDRHRFLAIRYRGLDFARRPPGHSSKRAISTFWRLSNFHLIDGVGQGRGHAGSPGSVASRIFSRFTRRRPKTPPDTTSDPRHRCEEFQCAPEKRGAS